MSADTATRTGTDGSGGLGPAAEGGDGAAPGTPTRAGVDTELAAADLRRLRRSWALGAVPVIVVFAWLLMAERWAPLQRQYFDDFFDAQARSFFDGRWDVPPETVGYEGFDVGGKTYIYFGVWPTLLRVPILLATDRLDGRLTTLSMVLAMAVLAVGAHRLNVVVRGFVRGPQPVSRREAVVTSALAVAALAGPPLWLGSAAIVHHEASLWGLAFAVAAMAELGRWLGRATHARLAGTTALAIGETASRFTLGLGVVVALAIVAAAAAVQRRVAARRDETREVLDGFRLRWIVAAIALVLGLSVIPNLARFGTLVSPPVDRQYWSATLSQRREFLADNHGAFFGVQFLPTTLLTYLRPDGFDVRVTFPWVDFPRAGPSVVGDPTFDDLVWTTSAPAAMPALAVLAVPGVVWLVRAARRRTRAALLGAMWVGAGVSAAAVLTIGHIANRYLDDLVLVLLLPALVGVHALAGRMPGWRPRWRRALWALCAVLVAGGAWMSLGLGIVHQRERGPVVPEPWRAELFRWRADLPGGSPPILRFSATGWAILPDEAGDGTVAVVGDCLGMYLRVGEDWVGVSRGPGVGVYDLRVDLDRLDAGPPWARVPLIVFGDDRDAGIVALSRLDDGRVRADVTTGQSSGWLPGYPVDLGGEVTIRVSIDPRTGENLITSGQEVLHDRRPGDLGQRPTVGRLPDGVARIGLADSYPGVVTRPGYDKGVCRSTVGTR